MPYQTPNRVAILGGDPSVRRALALLLRDYGYDSFPIEEPAIGSPDAVLRDARLLLFLATSNTDYASSFLDGMKSTSETASIPILMLSSTSHSSLSGDVRTVPWPCHTETLVREIETMLSTVAEITQSRRYSFCKPGVPSET